VNVFLDTSAIVKIYVDEAYSDIIRGIYSGSRKRLISDARALLAYLAVEETGHKATDVARILGIKRVSVHHAAKKGKKVIENLPSPL